MPAAAPAPATDVADARWGMGDALGGWVVAYASAIVLGSLLLAAFGYADTDPDDLPLSAIALGYPPLWLGFVGVPVAVAAAKGRGIVHDFRLRVKAIDVPVGVVAGALTQWPIVVLVSLPVLWLSGQTVDDLAEPARELSDKANTTGGVLLFFLIVGICAPIAEEIFFRGLVMRSIEKRFGVAWGLVGSSVVFGATHFQPLQFLPLTVAGLVFGALVVRSGRLGPGIIAHMAFNTTSVIFLVAT